MGNQFSYNSAFPGMLTIPCELECPGLRKEYRDRVLWQIDFAPGKCEPKWSKALKDDENTGHGVTCEYTVKWLPKENTDFGPAQAAVRILNKEGAVVFSKSVPIEIFFDPEAYNWGQPSDLFPDVPPTKPEKPNWFYYWMQIVEITGSEGASAFVYSNTSFDGSISGFSGLADFDKDNPMRRKWVPILADNAYKKARLITSPLAKKRPPDAPGDVVKGATGIDSVAWVAFHEKQHAQFMNQSNWWPNGPDGEPAPDDDDKDGVPDSVEPTFMISYDAKYIYDPTQKATFSDDWNYSLGVFTFTDAEDSCLIAQERWINGSADAQDWSRKG